jgi:hypothetical protein
MTGKCGIILSQEDFDRWAASLTFWEEAAIDNEKTMQPWISAGNDSVPSVAPDALLLVAPACPHCAAVLEGLTSLVKEGAIGRLEVINAAVHPDAAAERGAKSVPWFSIGRLRFDGGMSPGELRQRAQRAGDPDVMPSYFLAMLRSGRRRHVEAQIREQPQASLALVALLEDPQASMAVRLGIGAVLESLQGTDFAAPMVSGLGRLAGSPDAPLRADACHCLSLIGSAEAIPYLRAGLADEDAEVREICAEALAAPGQTGISGP